MTRSAALLLSNLSTLGIVSQKTVEAASSEDINSGRAANGTGPYRWAGFIPSQQVTLGRNDTYWGRAVPGFGPANASVLIMGLAPAAHGANRTGRVFTGDRSGDWLFKALHHVGLANQPTSVSIDDGLQLNGCRVGAAVRCAPPANAPTPEERDECAPFLQRELQALTELRVIVALGNFAYQAIATHLGVRPRPKFGHGVEAASEVGLAGEVFDAELSQASAHLIARGKDLLHISVHIGRVLNGSSGGHSRDPIHAVGRLRLVHVLYVFNL